MKRAGVSYDDLVKRLAEMGIEETVGSVTVKVNRGTYPAWFPIRRYEGDRARTYSH